MPRWPRPAASRTLVRPAGLYGPSRFLVAHLLVSRWCPICPYSFPLLLACSACAARAGTPKRLTPAPGKKRQGGKKQPAQAYRKVAEILDEDTKRSSADAPTARVSDAVMQRIKKALALGLHPGGSSAEKEHAMRRATKLMMQHGLSAAGA